MLIDVDFMAFVLQAISVARCAADVTKLICGVGCEAEAELRSAGGVPFGGPDQDIDEAGVR